MRKTLYERVMAKVDVGHTDACWPWTGAKKRGYGVFSVTERQQSAAHRIVYELLVGPIPDGLQLDHLCRRTDCVNPNHMEPVTGRENKLRGHTVNAMNAAKTACVNGHPFDEANTLRTAEGRRVCRTCKRLRARARRAGQVRDENGGAA